jgi:LacI family repressor for deo operon, udp, cdd, tsx, nupC, and nupG
MGPVANIYEVARRAGVSTATVSRVLSQPSVVAPDTRRKVLQAVELLDYAPNSAAKNLRTLRTGKILVTVPDISNPFAHPPGIEDAAQREGARCRSAIRSTTKSAKTATR